RPRRPARRQSSRCALRGVPGSAAGWRRRGRGRNGLRRWGGPGWEWPRSYPGSRISSPEMRWAGVQMDRKENHMPQMEIRIEGMTCVHCEKTVAEALTAAGAEKVETGWREGRATFEAPAGSDAQLKAAVEGAGYRVVTLERRAPEAHGFEPLVG